MIVAKRGLSYRPNPSAPAEISDQLKENTSQYVNYIDWIYDTSKNTIPLSANHVARYNPLDLKIVGALFVVSAISIGLHNVWEKKHVQA